MNSPTVKASNVYKMLLDDLSTHDAVIAVLPQMAIIPETITTVDDCIKAIIAIDYLDAEMTPELIEYAYNCSVDDVRHIITHLMNFEGGVPGIGGQTRLAEQITVLQTHKCLCAINIGSLKCLRMIYEKYGCNTIQQMISHSIQVDQYDCFIYLLGIGQFEEMDQFTIMVYGRTEYLIAALAITHVPLSDNLCVAAMIGRSHDTRMKSLKYLKSVNYTFADAAAAILTDSHGDTVATEFIRACVA